MLILFAASRDQRTYFSALKEKVALPIRVIKHKSLWLPKVRVRYPVKLLWEQANLLTIRKKNSAKGMKKPAFIWPLFTGLNFIQALWLFSVYTRWLDKEGAGYVGVWNGKKFRQAILVLVIKQQNKKPIFFETGPLPGKSAIDPKGVNFYSSIPHELSFYVNRQFVRESETPKIQKLSVQLPESFPIDYIFVPFQVVEDSNIYLHSPWIRNMRALFNVCLHVNQQLEHPRRFVFKQHPACDENYDDLIEHSSEWIQFENKLETPMLIEHADAVLTINSTVGLEGLVRRKKVIVLGDALFGFEGVSFPAQNEETLVKLLNNIETLDLNDEVINSFIDYLTTRYAVEGNGMRAPTNAHWASVEARLSLLLEGKNKEALGLDSL